MNGNLFYNVLEMSLKASFIILIVLAMRLYLKEKPKIFSYLLWIVVFLRLLCPIALELPVSFVPKDVSSGIAMKEVADTYVGKREKYWSYTEEFDTAMQEGYEPVLQMDETGEISSAYVVTGKNGTSKPNTVYDTVLPVLRHLWIAGIAGLICYSFITYIKMKKKLVGAVPLDEERDIYLSDYIETAFVIGVLYPKIYLPSALSEKEQSYILLHEQQHIRRKDHWVKIAAFLALCIHWFNPLVWIAFFEMTKDMEMSCDEAVLRKLGSEIQEEYAASLLGLATGRRIVAAMPLAFGEGDTKARIANAMRWEKISVKSLIATGILCVLVGTVSLANAEDDTVHHPYEWTSTVTEKEITSCKVVSWKDADLVYPITKEQIADFIYVLNGLSKYDMTREIPENKKEISVLFTCGKQEILLTYGNGITTFSFQNDSRLWLDQKVWQTDANNMTICMRKLMAQGTKTDNGTKNIVQRVLPPTKEEVLEMREKVLAGMSQEEIDRLTELVQVENQNREHIYLKGDGYWDYKDPESPYWRTYTESGKIILDYMIPCDAPGFDSEGDMTIEEYNETFGTPYMTQVKVPKAERFYSYIDKLRSLVKTDLLDADFDRLEECMRLAVENHDVNYFHEIYHILHDLDYYLLRYGPVDVGAITDDDSTVRKYYGILKVYRGVLPLVMNVYEETLKAKWDSDWDKSITCVERTYYRMSDGTFRVELTSNKKGLTTEVYSYPYRVEVEGVHPILQERVNCSVLSQTKDLSFDDIEWEADVFENDIPKAVLVEIQRIEGQK